jgi:hypothetical protein
MIDEDGERLLTITDLAMDKIKQAKEVKAFRIDEEGKQELEVWDINTDATTTYDEISDIVLAGNTFTIFHDELSEAKVKGDQIIIKDLIFQIL